MKGRSAASCQGFLLSHRFPDTQHGSTPGPREAAAQRAAAVPLVPKSNRGDSSDGSGLYQEGGKRGERYWSPWETEKLPEGGGF